MNIKQLLILVLIVLCGNILLVFSHLPSYLGFVQKEEPQIIIPSDNSEITTSALKGEILALESEILSCELVNEELNKKAENYETLLNEKYVEIDRLEKELHKINME